MTTATERSARTADGALRAEVDTLKQDLGDLRADIRTLVTDLVGAGRTGMTETTQRLSSMASNAADRTARQGERIAGSIEGEIRERPFTSCGVAFLAGLGVGAFFLSRRG